MTFCNFLSVFFSCEWKLPKKQQVWATGSQCIVCLWQLDTELSSRYTQEASLLSFSLLRSLQQYIHLLVGTHWTVTVKLHLQCSDATEEGRKGVQGSEDKAAARGGGEETSRGRWAVSLHLNLQCRWHFWHWDFKGKLTFKKMNLLHFLSFSQDLFIVIMLLERNKNCNGALGNKENVEKINKIYLKKDKCRSL